MRSRSAVSSRNPALHAAIVSFMGIPASTMASTAALIAAARTPPSACSTWMVTSSCDRAMSSVLTHVSRHPRTNVDSSLVRRSPLVRRLRSPVLNAAMDTSHLISRRSSRRSDGRLHSRGPCTAASTLVLPSSKIALPSVPGERRELAAHATGLLGTATVEPQALQADVLHRGTHATFARARGFALTKRVSSGALFC